MRFSILIVLLLFGLHGGSQSLKRTQVIENDSMYIGIVNKFLAPVEIKMNGLDSTKAFTKVKSYGLLKTGDTLKNALIIPIKKIKDTSEVDIKEFASFKATYGDPNTPYDNDYPYELPYPKGKSYKIIQSFGGKFSHNKTHSRYAIDFGLPVGDTITAIRPGIVFYVKEDSKEHCPTRKCIDMANKIYVIHDDGTMAHYVHLDFEGALVEIGDKVKAKQPIGISGMSGFTTTPHLHLVLYKSGSVSIPYTFRSVKKKKLKPGKFYKNKG